MVVEDLATEGTGGGGRLNIKMSSYQYKDPHVKDKTVSRPFIFYMAIPIPEKDGHLGKFTFEFWKIIKTGLQITLRYANKLASWWLYLYGVVPTIPRPDITRHAHMPNALLKPLPGKSMFWILNVPWDHCARERGIHGGGDEQLT